MSRLHTLVCGEGLPRTGGAYGILWWPNTTIHNNIWSETLLSIGAKHVGLWSVVRWWQYFFLLPTSFISHLLSSLTSPIKIYRCLVILFLSQFYFSFFWFPFFCSFLKLIFFSISSFNIVLICNWASSVFLFLWGDLDLMIQWQIWKGNLGWNWFFFLRSFLYIDFLFWFHPSKLSLLETGLYDFLWFSLYEVILVAWFRS